MTLSDEDAALFYKLMWPLQFFVNQKLGILPRADTLEKYVHLSQDDKLRVRNALWEHADLIDEFIAANPASLSADELVLVQGWKSRVTGPFTIERFLKKGTIFIGSQEPPHVYLVLALYNSFEEILLPYPPPVYVKAVLLPFRGRIIYDGLLESHTIIFGPGVRSTYRDIYMRAKQRGEIIETMEPQDSLARPATARSRPVPAAGPELESMAAMAEKLKAPGQPVQGAALALLKASARLAQAATQNPDDMGALWVLGQSVQKALKRLQTTLDRADSGR